MSKRTNDIYKNNDIETTLIGIIVWLILTLIYQFYLISTTQQIEFPGNNMFFDILKSDILIAGTMATVIIVVKAITVIYGEEK